MTARLPDDEPEEPAYPSNISGIPDMSKSGNLYSVGNVGDESDCDGLVSNDPIDTGDPDSPQVERRVGPALPNVENNSDNWSGLPSADQAAELRRKAPELYDALIEMAKLKAETEALVRKAESEAECEALANLPRTGRPWAFAALVSVLVFCGYIASLGGAAEYIAGIVASINLVAMLALFMGFRPETERRRARKARRNHSHKQEKPD